MNTTMNSTMNEVDDDSFKWSQLALIIAMGSVLVIGLCAVCVMCYKTNKDNATYIKWVKVRKMGNPTIQYL